MADSPPSDEPRVVRFPGARKAIVPEKRDDFADYAAPAESETDYRHRMVVNVSVLLFVVALIGAALWLADSMASMRRNQDCVLSGRHGCTPVEAAPAHRW